MSKISTATARAVANKYRKSKQDVKKTFEIDDGSFEVVVKTYLTVKEQTTFINRVVSGCFDVKGDYRPEYFEPMVNATFIQVCTNLPAISTGESTSNGDVMDIDAMDDLFHALSIGDIDDPEEVKYSAFTLYSYMYNLCTQFIEFRKQRVTAFDSVGDFDTEASSAVAAFKSLIQKISDKVDGIELSEVVEYAKKLSEVSDGFTEDKILKGMMALKNSGDNK